MWPTTAQRWGVPVQGLPGLPSHRGQDPIPADDHRSQLLGLDLALGRWWRPPNGFGHRHRRRPSVPRAPRAGRLVLGHRVLCPSRRTIGVVPLTIARWPLARDPHAVSALHCYHLAGRHPQPWGTAQLAQREEGRINGGKRSHLPVHVRSALRSPAGHALSIDDDQFAGPDSPRLGGRAEPRGGLPAASQHSKAAIPRPACNLMATGVVRDRPRAGGPVASQSVSTAGRPDQVVPHARHPVMTHHSSSRPRSSTHVAPA